MTIIHNYYTSAHKVLQMQDNIISGDVNEIFLVNQSIYSISD
jgi:hypothetical protein